MTDNIIGRKIVEYRKKNKLTQKEFARKLYVTNTTVSRWESGVTVPNSEQLLDLAALLGESVDSLLGNETAGNEPVGGAQKTEKKKIKPWHIVVAAAMAVIVIAGAVLFPVIKHVREESLYEVTDKFEAEWAEINAVSAAGDFYGNVEKSSFASNGQCVAQYGVTGNVLSFKIISSKECKAKMFVSVVSLYDMVNNLYSETEFDSVWNLYVNPTEEDLSSRRFVKTGIKYVSTDIDKTWYGFIEVAIDVVLKKGDNEIYFAVPIGVNGSVGLNMDYIRFECDAKLKWKPVKTNGVRPPDEPEQSAKPEGSEEKQE